MRKLLFTGMAVVMAASVTAACGNTDTSEDKNGSGTPAAGTGAAGADADIKGSITVVTHRTDLVDTKFKEYADAFKKKYPNVTDVEFEAIKDYDPTMKVRLSTGELGDVSMIPNAIPQSKLGDYYVPLDDLGLDDKLYFPDWRSYGGQTYGIPSGVNTDGIVYNKQAFAKAGITDVPKTLDELYADMEKLKAAGITPFATNFKDRWPLAEWDTMAFVISGDSNFRLNLTKTDTPFALDKPYGKSLSILKTMIDKGYTEKDLMSTDWEASKKDVAAGNTAMYALGNWVIPQVIENGAKPEDIGFFPFPYDNSGRLNAYMAPDYEYGVSKSGKNIATAKAFVKFMVEETDYADFSGEIPVLKSQQPKLPQLKEYLSHKPNTLDVKPDPEVYTNVQNKAQIDFYGGSYIQKVILSKDFKAALDELNKRWADARKALGVE